MKKLQEKAKDIKIIFFDIDDTLRVKDTGFMPESISLVFKKLHKKGILTGIATGRNFYGIIPEIKSLSPDYFVTANGSYVEDKNQKVVYKHPIPHDFVLDLVDWLDKEKSDYIFYGRHQVMTNQWTDLAQEVIYPVYGKVPVKADFYKKEEIYQIVSLSDHDQELKLPEKMTEELRMVRWHPYSSDILSKTESKAIGVEKVLETLGLTAENMMNFGDGLNDEELFDYAHLSVAMKKSHPEILEKADYITDTVENDGIYKALIELGIIE